MYINECFLFQTSDSTKTRKRGEAKGLSKNKHLTIELVNPVGKPVLPKKNATTFVHQCGVVVRNNVPICIQEWNQPKKEGMENVSYVNKRLKEVLVEKLLANFILPVLKDDPEETAAIRKRVEHFALKKMAEMFNKYKNRLWEAYAKKGEVPVFGGTLEKQKHYWNAFVQYKESDLAKKRSATNKANAGLKIYHHKTGGGGYAGCEPKWAAQEAELKKRKIKPVTEGWPQRARNWMLGHCKGYNMENGELILDETNLVPKEAIEKAIALVNKGEFVVDRENDELTKALGNPEKSGRARGYGPDYTWFLAFSECNESYRSRERAKKRKEQEEKTRLSKLEESQEELLAIVKNQQLQLDELRGTGASHQLQLQQDSHRRSSVASTEGGASREEQMERYPVDYIREKTPCDLHVPVRNLSFKAAEGYALTCEETARWNTLEIPDGFSRVGVDEILPGYHTMELDIPGPENEKTLGEVQSGLILWKKKYIVFPGSPPRAPSPPGRDSPPPSPHDDDRDEHHSPSPMNPPHQRQATPDPTSPPPAPTKPTKSQKRKRAASSSTGSQRKSQAERLPRIPPSPPIRAWDRTVEENEAIVQAEVKQHFTRKKKPQKQTFDPETIKWATGFLTHPSQYEINKPDDYTRALRKIDAITPRNVTGSGLPKLKGVAQLGEQAKKTISPLKVVTDMDLAKATRDADFARDAGISVSQAYGKDIPFLAQDTWKWEYGKPLVPKDRMKSLGTQMRKLHDWYLKATEKGTETILMLVTEEHFNGEDLVPIYLEELFQLYKQDALDLSIVSAYCL